MKAGASAELKEIYRDKTIKLSMELDRSAKMVVLVSVEREITDF